MSSETADMTGVPGSGRRSRPRSGQTAQLSSRSTRRGTSSTRQPVKSSIRIRQLAGEPSQQDRRALAHPAPPPPGARFWRGARLRRGGRFLPPGVLGGRDALFAGARPAAPGVRRTATRPQSISSRPPLPTPVWRPTSGDEISPGPRPRRGPDLSSLARGVANDLRESPPQNRWVIQLAKIGGKARGRQVPGCPGNVGSAAWLVPAWKIGCRSSPALIRSRFLSAARGTPD